MNNKNPIKNEKKDDNNRDLLHLINILTQNNDDLKEKIQILNKIKVLLSFFDPNKKSPVSCIQWIPIEYIHANSYNPNTVAPPEMELLYISVKEDGYTQPIVCFKIKENNYEIVDGYHRYLTMLHHKDIYNREHGCMPVSFINENDENNENSEDKSIEERKASTIRHNRAKGSHSINKMSNLILSLSSKWNDYKISKKLGMEIDEIIKMKQLSSLESAFKNHVFSKSWDQFILNHGVGKNE
jgi:hypothetical protein